MQYHTLPITIKDGYNTQGYFAVNRNGEGNPVNPPKNLIVFVHGLMGDSVGTWANFHEFIADTDKFRDADIIFYGYKSLARQANNQALTLLDFVNRLQQPLANNILPKTLPERNYSRTIFVAHSLGAIVTRRMLLFANKNDWSWVHNTRMVLFAPVHNGAPVFLLLIELGTTLFGKILNVASLIARYKYPVLKDLPPDSPTIKNLKDETNELLNAGKGEFTRAFTVVWAENEKVVDDQPFCKDPVPKHGIDKSHTTVCKPVATEFEQPVELVLAALQ